MTLSKQWMQLDEAIQQGEEYACSGALFAALVVMFERLTGCRFEISFLLDGFPFEKFGKNVPARLERLFRHWQFFGGTGHPEEIAEFRNQLQEMREELAAIAAGNGWLTFLGNPHRSRMLLIPEQGYECKDGDVQCAIVWETPCPGRIVAAPVAVGDTVVVVDRSGCMRAVNGADGSDLWQLDLPAPCECSPLIVDDKLYTGTDHGDMLAVELLSGKPRWLRHLAAGMLRSTPFLLDDTILFAGTSGRLLALTIETGKLAWERRVPDAVFSNPTAIDNGFLIGCDNGVVYRFNRDGSNKLPWFQTNDRVRATVTTSGNTAAIGSFDGNLYLCVSHSAEELWRVSLNNKIFASPLITDAHVVCADNGGAVTALHRKNGELSWQRRGEAMRAASPQRLMDWVISADDAGHLTLFRLTNGETAGELLLPGPIRSGLVPCRNLFVTAAGDRLIAIRIDSKLR